MSCTNTQSYQRYLVLHVPLLFLNSRNLGAAVKVPRLTYRDLFFVQAKCQESLENDPFESKLCFCGCLFYTTRLWAPNSAHFNNQQQGPVLSTFF